MASFGKRFRKGGGVFWSVYFTVDGVQFERSAGRSRAFAKRWAARLTEQELLRKAGFPDDGPFRSTWRLSDLRARDLEDARLSGKETKSRSRRWDVIEDALRGDPLLHQVTGPVAEGFRLTRLRVAGPATVNRDLSVLSAAWTLAARHGEAGENPWRKIPRAAEKAHRRPPVALEEADAHRVIRLAWERAAGMHLKREGWEDAAIIEILMLTASRLSQVLRLRKDQIVGTDLVFPPQKGGTERVFDLAGETPDEMRLAELVHEAVRQSKSSRWIFPSRRARGKPRENIRKFWTALLKDAGLESFHRHDLRATANTIAAYRGDKIPELQARMGHASARMASELYTRVHQRPIRPVSPSGAGAERPGGKRGKAADAGSEKSSASAGSRVGGKGAQPS